MGKTTRISEYRVMQTLNSGFGLAINSKAMVIAIKTSTKFYPIYDGETISGNVVMIDTYTYESQMGMKTVPVVIPYSEYRDKQE